MPSSSGFINGVTIPMSTSTGNMAATGDRPVQPPYVPPPQNVIPLGRMAQIGIFLGLCITFCRTLLPEYHGFMMPITAILVCYLAAWVQRGIIPALPNTSIDHDLSHVSTAWSKGSILAWLFGAVSIQSDAILRRNIWDDKSRWITVLSYSIAAFLRQVTLALDNDFGPSYTAAQYVADKGFESIAIIYFMGFAKALGRYLRADRLDQQVRLNYPAWPCYVLAALWLAGRSLQRGQPVFTYPPDVKAAAALWQPPFPHYLALPVSGIGALVGGVIAYQFTDPGTALQKVIDVVPAAVWLGFFSLHVGLCNTPTALALVPGDWSDEFIPVLISGLVTLYAFIRPFFDKPTPAQIEQQPQAAVQDWRDGLPRQT